MLIIRRLNCIDAASGIVTLKISQWSKITSVKFAALLINLTSNLRPLTYFQSDDTRCCINTIQPPDDEHIMLETCRGL
jgi:hypothetical protein